MQESKALHYVLGVALVLIAVFTVAASVISNSQATDTNTTVVIDNVSPTIESLALSDDAETGNGAQLVDDYLDDGGLIDTLVAGGTKDYYINGVVEDLNGRADITNISAQFFRSGVFSVCGADKNECYRMASCDAYDGPTSDQLYYSCGPFAVSYFADSTVVSGRFSSDDWTARVVVTDGTGLGYDTITKEMQGLLALDIPTSINFGILALGTQTTDANNQVLVIRQQGNIEADAEVSSASAMTCSVRGSIPATNQQWALSDIGFGSDGTSALASSPSDTELAVSFQDSDTTAPDKSLYWNISIPSSGAEGVCTGTTVITAVAH